MTENRNRPGDDITRPAQEAHVSAGATSNDTASVVNLAPVNKLTFAELLAALGYGDDRREHVVICWKFGTDGPDGHFTPEVKASEDAAPFVDMFFTAAAHKHPHVWFGINPMPADVKSRGTAKDVMRLAALYADLAVKAGGCPDLDTARMLIDDVSEVLGSRPVAVIHSGHGLQPIWPVERLSAETVEYPRDATKLLQRFRHVVETVAARHGCKVDNVFDLPRILRVPDTVNWKDPEHPAPTWCEADTGKPVTVEQIVQALDDFGAPEDRSGFGSGGNGQGPHTFSRPALVARVAKAPEGQRNRTLFGAAKDAARQGDLDTDMAEKLADAALSAGLDSAGIDSTIYSAAKAEDVNIVETPERPTGDREHADGDDGREDGLDVVEGMPRLWNATDLRGMTQPRWLAKNRLPRAAVSLLVGDEGIGKSLLWVWLAAAVTTGKPLIEFGVPKRDPGHVIVIVTEDDWSTTVLPRLQVAGADLSMVRVICTEEDGSGAPVFPRDLYLIANADPAPALIVVDAWLDTVPSRLLVKDAQQARQALHPWREVATVTDAVVLLLTHTNRVNSAQARDRYGATGELRKKARMTLFAQQDDHGNLVVGPEKANGAAPVSASTFAIQGVQFFPPTEDHDGTVPLLGYVSESAQTAREHITSAFEANHGPARDDVVAWLASYLPEWPRWATDVYEATVEAGFSKDKAKRAKHRLNVKTDRESSTGPWYWCLPQHSGSAPREHEESV